jgi:hypothetical protein
MCMFTVNMLSMRHYKHFDLQTNPLSIIKVSNAKGTLKTTEIMNESVNIVYQYLAHVI